MAKVVRNRTKSDADIISHARPTILGEYGDKKADVLYVAGEGMYLSAAGMRALGRNAEDSAEEHGNRRHSGPYEGQITEEQIEAWYHLIQATKGLQPDKREAKRTAYEATCYPGTDTEDPKEANTLHNERDEYELDRSQSRISMTVASTTPRYLNASAVKHYNYVSIKVFAPEGRPIVDVALSLDQFARFLLAGHSSPCTIDRFWSLTDGCILLEEVVKEPDTIRDRMARRIGDKLQSLDDALRKVLDEVDEQVASGKPMSKTKLAELRRDLEHYHAGFTNNRNFTIEQAKEELSSMVELAAINIAWEHGLSKQQLLENNNVQAMLASHTKALPAPSDDTE